MRSNMIKHYPYSFKPRLNKIEEARKQSIFERMKQATTPLEKREIIKETNPLFYLLHKEAK